MKLLILHLSDMHFGDEKNYEKKNIIGIVNALNTFTSDIQSILVIVSGDLTYEGSRSQFKKIVRFFKELKRGIFDRYKIQDIKFVIVPGNHDVDYTTGIGDRGHDGLEGIEKVGSYEEEIASELEKIEQFYVIAGRYYCFQNKNLLHKKTLIYGNHKILLNLINTAAFSSKDEDQGYHYLPSSVINRISEQADSDFVISVMHHPHHWFCWRCKKQLEEALYTRSDLIFVGHEHYESAMKVEGYNSSVNIYAGGKLCDRGDWKESEFHAALLDLESRDFITRQYIWNENDSIYEEKNTEQRILSKDRYSKYGLSVQPGFSKRLEEDKFLISASIMDYFVFPLLEEEYITEDRGRLSRSIDSIESFMSVLQKEGKIIVSGTNDSGKSILARAIYKELSKYKITLFISGSDVGNNVERTIRIAFEEAYSSDRAKYEAFKQSKPEDLAIVVDDIESVYSSAQDLFYSYINEHFGFIVETCLTEIDIDIRSRLKRRSNNRDFGFYRIAPFYANKRRELVVNVVRRMGNMEPDVQEHIIDILCDVLTKQKYLYGWNPEFIVQFAKYYCNNIGEAMQNDGSVFSKVFESNITQLLKPYAHKINVDKILVVLDKIAYGIYVQKKYPCGISDIDSWVQQYNTEYDSEIETRFFVDMLLDARIMKQTEDGYLFYDRNYLAYFTAREIKRRCLEDDDYTQFHHVMEYCYSGLNADILLFITYIVENRIFIEKVMQQGLEAVAEWSEFDLDNNDIPFFTAPVDQIVKPFEDGDREKEEEKQIEQEKKEVQSAIIANDASIFYGENEELDYVQKVMRSISLMVIIARTLPSFEHLMKKGDKEKCVELIYRMPLKIFEVLAKEIDESSSGLINDIKYLYENEFRKDKPDKKTVRKMENRDALYILKWEATSLLLDLIYASTGAATRNNTNSFIDRFPYYEKSIYGIEHLSSLARRDSVSGFTDEAERIFTNTKHSLTKTIIQRITRSFMVNSKKIKNSEIQSLNAKLFNQNIPQNRIMIERERNQQKKR